MDNGETKDPNRELLEQMKALAVAGQRFDSNLAHFIIRNEEGVILALFIFAKGEEAQSIAEVLIKE